MKKGRKNVKKWWKGETKRKDEKGREKKGEKGT